MLVDVLDTYNQCSKYDDKTPTSELPYGKWLKSSPLRGRLLEAKLEEETRRCQELKESLKQNKTRKKLNFDGPSSNSGAESGNNMVLAANVRQPEHEVEEAITEGPTVRFSKRGRTETSNSGIRMRRKAGTDSQ